MDAADIDILLAVLKFSWENGVVRGEPGAVQLTLLRVKLEAMKAKLTAPPAPEPAK